ncbi:uncharacterized protein Pbp49 isoform X2 [Linepithema humile]|uniref:uncharacterized protein Pbp49 isoform X2 n=1 Tax=Linepithema humile TaxID=83485 RepID=UPI00351DDDC9
MDQVYRLYDRQTLPKIYLKDYFQQYSELLKSYMCHKIDEQSEEKVFQLMGTDLSQTRTLLMTHYCSIDNLTLPTEAANTEEREKQGWVNMPANILNNTSLETIKVLKILSEEVSLKPKFQNGIPINFKNDDSKLICDTKLDSMTPHEEFLVYVRIYEPFQSQPRSMGYKPFNTPPVLKLKNVISIPGCQTLYELRRKIVCQSDLSIATEISENPNQKPGPTAKHIYKSGFFYIEDTFYNDTSASANIDYSSVILEWAAIRGIGPFKVASMDVKINSLCARFGFPWVYQHQGCCEHLIVLSDASFCMNWMNCK